MRGADAGAVPQPSERTRPLRPEQTNAAALTNAAERTNVAVRMNAAVLTNVPAERAWQEWVG